MREDGWNPSVLLVLGFLRGGESESERGRLLEEHGGEGDERESRVGRIAVHAGRTRNDAIRRPYMKIKEI